MLLGDGTGRFTAAPGTPVSTGSSAPSALAAGDLNGDGKLDLAAVNAGSASVSVLLNGVAPPLSGFVSFPAAPTAGQQVTFAYSAVGPVAAIDWDLNGDGVFDDAHGATAARVFAAPGSYPVSLRVTDVDGLATTTTRLIAVGLATPLLLRSAPPAGPTLISPFPIVRVSGRTSLRGAAHQGARGVRPCRRADHGGMQREDLPVSRWRTIGAKTLSVDPLKGRFLGAGVSPPGAGLRGRADRQVHADLDPEAQAPDAQRSLSRAREEHRGQCPSS